MIGFRNMTIFSAAAVLICAGAAKPQSIKVLSQMIAPPFEENCYLVYDEESRDAALVDVGGPIDSLVSQIEINKLKIKYILITHCHPDHVFGLPAIEKAFPEALVCTSRADYEDTEIYFHWAEAFDSSAVVKIKENPDVVKVMDFNYSSAGTPDIYIEDGQTLDLGNSKIMAFLAPGHSRGSICYYVGNALFSGDVLFYRSVGQTILPRTSWEDLVRSVNRLYSRLPDETVVYPGHGRSTNIGDEKKYNSKIPSAKKSEKDEDSAED